ncbi:hypothetical protein BaRGS_00020325 [Batillaria attramentaria]|uniref:Protein max n=1 Tax=Batillaria attramentaria TaxID=370345 RepID=A0ABD0KM71_9CAEN
MSDEDRDVDIESDEDDDDDGNNLSGSGGAGSSRSFGQGREEGAEKRAHHNALERKRRDHIKDSFHSLRDSVPSLQGEKVSRAQILKKAADYITFMRHKNQSHQQDIDDLKRQNGLMEQQIRSLEKARTTGQFAAQSSANVKSKFYGGSDSESSEEEEVSGSRRKKLKTADS